VAFQFRGLPYPSYRPLRARFRSLIPAAQAGSWRTSDQTSSQRGYGYKWQKAREQFLREHPLCLMCQAQGRVEAATVVDHITPHRGDQSLFWRRSNWR